MSKEVPWTDFESKPIKEGDTIVHPSGESGKVLFHDKEWRVDYGDGVLSRLCLQIGDRGMAVVK